MKTSKCMNSAIAVLFCFVFAATLNAQTSKKEQQLVDAVDTHLKDALSLLETSVNINSGTMNFEGVQEVGRLYQKELDALGFKTELTSGEAYNRAGHLVAAIEGKKGPKIVMIGHLDTVFELDSPFQEFQMRNDSIVEGPGVADMKGGDVIIILAMKALKDAGLLKDMRIKIVMTGDEEKSGNPLALSKKDVIDAAQWADIALGFENGDNNPKTIVVARRGSLDWKLKVKGQPAHSSQVFSEKVGVGAIYETSRILNAFYEQLSEEKDLTFNPGFIVGGTEVSINTDQTGGNAFGKNNVVSQAVEVHGDIRAVSLEQLESAKKTMHAIVAENYPKTSAELIFDEGGYPPLDLTDGNTQLLATYNLVSQDLGFGSIEAVNPRNAGAADISFTSGYVDMAIDGMGLTGGSGDHTVEETANLNRLAEKAKVTAVLLYRLMAKQK